MIAMTSPEICRECGTALPLGSPRGYCPKCMLGLALEGASSTHKPGSSKTSEASEPSRDNGPIANRGNSLSKPAENPGDEISGYRLLQEIGHGGCGVVYMAEQERPVHRRVALKVIKIGMDTRQVVARFEAERQALARMDHPNIAKVLEAGATRSGRPYFAMELVGGQRITDYCDQNELNTDDRLELFVQVCRAIQHAHQKGIIHRDIKPSNVLVAQHDGVAVPKVIDFGIAKATQGKLIDQTLFTAFEQFMGTPVYMSPEQAELGGLDVDTRSDIYSLGVLLYELLTGKTPFDLDSSKANGVEFMRRTVLEKEPVKPSTRLSTMRDEQLKAVARTRRTDAPRLVKMIRRDLDWIVMKCLEKDRGRRYETANGLATDIQRYLNDEPVLACPPSAAYRISKFISRNRLTTFSVGAISITLILGTAISTWQAVKATRAEREQSRLRQEAQTARAQATEELWRSYLAEARARRLTRETGTSFDSLAAIAKAAAIRPSLELRNEAIAALAQADIRLVDTKQLNAKPDIAIDLSAPRYAVCDESGRVSIRRESDNAELATLPPTNLPAVAVWSFSPDGDLVQVLYADHHLRVWDWERSRCILEAAQAITGQFSPDSKQLALIFAGKIVLFDLSTAESATAKENISFDTGPGLWSLRFHPDGTKLAVFSETRSNLFVLDLSSGKPPTTVRHDGGFFRMTWSPDGKYLVATCRDVHNCVHVWDTESWTELKNLPNQQTISVGFNPQGTLLVTSSWDGRTRLWDFPNRRELVRIYNSGEIIGFRPDGRRLIETEWGSPNIALFDVANPRGLRTLRVHESLPKGPTGFVAFSRDGKFLAFKAADGLSLWDVEAYVEIGLYNQNGGASLIGFDSEDRHLIAVDSEGLLLWPVAGLRDSSAENGRTASERLGGGFPPPVRPSEKVLGGTGLLSPDGEYCYMVGNNRCQILSTRTFKDSVFTGIHRGARFSAANRDCSLIATGGWHTQGVMVWDGRTGKLIKSFYSPDSTTVAFSPNGRYLVTAARERYQFWEVGSWSPFLSFPQQKDNDFAPVMVYSPDGSILAGTHSRSVVRLHNSVTGEVLADLEAPDAHQITGLAFNNDGTKLAVCEGHQATRVWDLQVIRSNLVSMGLDWKVTPASVQQAAR